MEPGRNLNTEEQAYADSAYESWAQYFGSDSKCNPTGLRITIDDQAVVEMCQRCPPGNCPDGPTPKCPNGCAYGCLVRNLIVSQDDTHALCSLIIHETLHWLGSCYVGDPDSGHTNNLIWQDVLTDATRRICDP